MEVVTNDYIGSLINYLVNTDLEEIKFESAHVPVETDKGMKSGRLVYIDINDIKCSPVMLSVANGTVYAHFIQLNKKCILFSRGESGGWCNIITCPSTTRGGLSMSEFIKKVIPVIKEVLEDNIELDS